MAGQRQGANLREGCLVSGYAEAMFGQQAGSEAGWAGLFPTHLTSLEANDIVDPMATLNVTLPDSIRDDLEAQARRAGFASRDAYVLDLIRKDLIAQGERELAAKLQSGIDSGDAITVDRLYWERKKAAIRQRK